jgi:hypothetical protein
MLNLHRSKKESDNLHLMNNHRFMLTLHKISNTISDLNSI